IVVALTAIANFTIPAYSTTIAFRIVLFASMSAAAASALSGILLVYIMDNIHLLNLKSFGVPYPPPYAPFFASDWNDVIIRTPIQTRRKRPEHLSTEDKISLDN